jgi:riboflavin kinase / FMN adenylyltransferase
MVVTHGSLQAGGGRHALTIGNFDGVHRGHRALIDRVTAKAAELGVRSCVLTFEPHPREFFAPHAAPARITRLRDKLELLAGTGVQRVHIERFDARLAGLSAAGFIDKVLLRGLRARWVLVGRDFRFGARRAGNFAMLEAAASRQGFGLEAMPDVRAEGARISSSAVRAALEAADFGRAEELLGRPYTLSGRVAHGSRLGRAIGYPTANIVLRHPPPLGGVFVVEVHGIGPAVASVGRRPTVNPVPMPLLEVHLLDWEGNLYGEHLRVRFLKKLRDEEKFDGIEALKRAIATDAERAAEYFAKHG